MEMHSVLGLKLDVTKVVIRVVLNVGRKARIDWMFDLIYKIISQKALVSSLSFFY
jgi:hypothetical protein